MILSFHTKNEAPREHVAAGRPHLLLQDPSHRRCQGQDVDCCHWAVLCAVAAKRTDFAQFCDFEIFIYVSGQRVVLPSPFVPTSARDVVYTVGDPPKLSIVVWFLYSVVQSPE